MHLHQDWVYCCDSYACGVLDIREDDITFSSSKLFHAYGLGNALMFPFHAGATTVLYPGKPQAKAILETAQAHRPTLFFSVPTLYAAMLQEAEQDALRLDSRFDWPFRPPNRCLPTFFAVGSSASEWRSWTASDRLKCCTSISRHAAGEVRPGSTGQAVPGYELALVDDSGQPAPAGAIGDLMVAGPSTAPCYWNREELTPGTHARPMVLHWR